MTSEAEITLNESNYDKERISRVQAELDTYLSRKKTFEDPHIYIGQEYEKYIGYLCTQHGYYVDFNGIKKQKQDAGIDIIAKSGKHTLLIQCKCWNSESRINENVIDQLVGSKRYYSKANNIPEEMLIAVLVTSTLASDEAKKHAKLMGVVIRERVYLKTFPRIKGFLFHNGDNAELEYRLPFDKDYYKDSPYTYFHTVQEAEEAGYTRGSNASSIRNPLEAAPSVRKRTMCPMDQSSVHMDSKPQTKQKVIVPQNTSTPQEERKAKEKPSVFDILFRVAYILVMFISTIIVYNISTMEKGRLISAVISGIIFGYLGFIVIIAIVSGIVGSIKELIDHFK